MKQKKEQTPSTTVENTVKSSKSATDAVPVVEKNTSESVENAAPVLPKPYSKENTLEILPDKEVLPAKVPVSISDIIIQFKAQKRKSSDEIALSVRKKAVVLGTLIFALTLISVLLLFFAHQRVSQLHETRKLSLVTEQEALNLAQASTFLSAQKEIVESVTELFPDEQSVVSFLSVLENLVAAHATAVKIEFASSQPIKDSSYSYLPLTIQLSADRENFLQLLSKLEKVPFVFQVMWVSGADFESNRWRSIIINARLYVASDFKKK